MDERERIESDLDESFRRAVVEAEKRAQRLRDAYQRDTRKWDEGKGASCKSQIQAYVLATWSALPAGWTHSDAAPFEQGYAFPSCKEATIEQLTALFPKNHDPVVSLVNDKLVMQQRQPQPPPKPLSSSFWWRLWQN